MVAENMKREGKTFRGRKVPLCATLQGNKNSFEYLFSDLSFYFIGAY